MRDPLAPIVEGVDFSGFVNRYSFECEPFFIDAAESATMLDGSTVHDVFPVKARFSWKLNSLSAEQYAALNAAFDAGATRGTVSAQIFDPTINAVRSAQFHVTRPAFVFGFTARDHMSTAGSVLTLEDAAPRTLPAVTAAPRQSVATRDPLAPVIEDFDLSGIVNRYSFRCEPFQTEGDNGGTLLDGSTVRDVLANKVRLSWTLNAVSAAQYAALCAALSSGTEPDTVSAYVYDPTINATYIASFHVTFPVFRFAFHAGQCIMAYADSSLVLEETGDEKTVVLPIIVSGNGWALYDTGLLDIYYDGNMPAVVGNVPWWYYREQIISTVIRDSVTNIGEHAFLECTNLTSVVIPDSVVSIGFNAFVDCTALESITIPNGVIVIAGDTFDRCTSLINVTIPNTVISIGEYAFTGCTSLERFTISNNMTSIEPGTFSGCASLTSVTIPDGVTSIGHDAFIGCNALADVYYGGTKSQWDAIEIGDNNTPLLNATIHYNSTGQSE